MGERHRSDQAFAPDRPVLKDPDALASKGRSATTIDVALETVHYHLERLGQDEPAGFEERSQHLTRHA